MYCPHLQKVILIFAGFQAIFNFGLKKYYRKTNDLFDDFRQAIINNTVYGLLVKAQHLGIIIKTVNLSLFCELYFNHFEEIAFKNTKLFENVLH